MYNGKIQRIYNVTEKIRDACTQITADANGLGQPVYDYLINDVNKCGHILVVHKMGMITGGFIKGHIEDTGLDKLFQIDWFYVRPRFQWRGIGERLFKTCVGYAILEGASMCYLFSSNEKSANRFYQKHDFHEAAEFFTTRNVLVKSLKTQEKQIAIR